MKKICLTLLALLCTAMAALAVEGDNSATSILVTRSNKIPVDTTIHSAPVDEMVIIGGDTVSIIIPQKNYGRFDRGLYNYLFIPRGQWAFGLTASYGEFSTDDVQILSVLKGLDMNIKAYSVKPSMFYSFRNNQVVGLKFNYTNMGVNLDNMSFDFSDDMSFTIGGVSYASRSYSTGIFYRNYVGLGRMKRFGVFNEVDLSLGGGRSVFNRMYNSMMKETRTESVNVGFNFSPGLCVYIMDNVSFDVSFGVFGLNVTNDRQYTDGVFEGSRTSSGANFRFNIFNINFGMAVCI